jgi:hypothetical protein
MTAEESASSLDGFSERFGEALDLTPKELPRTGPAPRQAPHPTGQGEPALSLDRSELVEVAFSAVSEHFHQHHGPHATPAEAPGHLLYVLGKAVEEMIDAKLQELAERHSFFRTPEGPAVSRVMDQ